MSKNLAASMATTAQKEKTSQSRFSTLPASFAPFAPLEPPPMNAPLPESIRKALESVTLDDKYALDHGRAFMSGVQALVRLPMLQRQRDAMGGLNTAGFISGYRG